MTSLKRLFYIILISFSMAKASLQLNDELQSQPINHYNILTSVNDFDTPHQFMLTKDAVKILQATTNTYLHNIKLSLDCITLVGQDYEDISLFCIKEIDSIDDSRPYSFRGFDFVIYERGRDLGTVNFFENSKKRNGGHLSIGLISVNPGFQKQGIASRAIQRLSKSLDYIADFDCQTLSLHVDSSNIKAALIYAKAGFWPYEYDHVTSTLIPLSIKDSAKFFFDQVAFQQVKKTRLMIRHKNAHNLPLSGKASCADIEAILNKYCKVEAPAFGIEPNAIKKKLQAILERRLAA